MRERTRLENSIKTIDEMERDVTDCIDLIELGELESEEEVIAEAMAALVDYKARSAKAEFEALLSGEADANDCYVEIHAGAGGTEAQDWAEMLLRMYARWCQAHKYKIEWLEESPGE